MSDERMSMPPVPDLKDIPWAGWLEEGLRDLMGMAPQCIAMSAILPDGEIYTGYWEASCADKIQIAGNIQMDATLDMLRANGDILREVLEEEQEAENFAAWDSQFEDSGE